MYLDNISLGSWYNGFVPHHPIGPLFFIATSAFLVSRCALTCNAACTWRRAPSVRQERENTISLPTSSWFQKAIPKLTPHTAKDVRVTPSDNAMIFSKHTILRSRSLKCETRTADGSLGRRSKGIRIQGQRTSTSHCAKLWRSSALVRAVFASSTAVHESHGTSPTLALERFWRVRRGKHPE